MCQGNRLGHIVAGAFVTRGVFGRSKGSGRPAVLSIAAALLSLALAPAGASAAVPSIEATPLFAEPVQSSITLKALVTPQGSALSDCRFAYGIGSSLNQQAACEGTDEVQGLTVSAEAGKFKLGFGGQKTEDIAFDAPAGVLQAQLQALSSIGPGAVFVTGGPGSADGSTPYVLTFRGSLAGKDVEQISAEDGSEPLSGTGTVGAVASTQTQGKTALEIINSNLTESTTVSARLTGLTPASTYSFRLIATNADGPPSEGPLRSFRTHDVPAGGACPNEAIRQAQHSTGLGDCRAFERVSPAEKGGGDIIAEGLSTMASDSGDAATFESRLVFGDAVGSGTVGRTTYLARRGAGGWSTRSVTPMSQPYVPQTFYAQTRVEVFADDLSSALVWAYDLPAVSDDPPALENVYLENTTTGALRTVNKSQEDQLEPNDFLNTNFDGYSADAKHVAFDSFKRMLPGMPPSSGRILYKWDDGALSLAGTLPDGSLPPGGVKVAPSTIKGVPSNLKGTMSADGTRLAFSASPEVGAPLQLYLHVDGRPSVWVSEPEMSDENDKTPRNGIVFEGMTPDGENVFFSSEDPLVEEDTAPGPDEYRFTYSADAASNGGNLTLITNDGEAPNSPISFGGTLVGMSDDAKRVYLHEGNKGLKLWEEGVPGLTAVHPSAARVSGKRSWLTLVASQPGHARVSPDGNWLAFMGEQMYLYDRAEDSLTCVSCPSDATIVPTVTSTGRREYLGFRPRFLSNDGKVFFTSTGALVPEDTNGVADVYEYDGQTKTLSLLSSGTGSEASEFADASKSGDDVFILSRQQLVPSDHDEYADLYDVRAGGGFDEPALAPTAPCNGEACQGTQGAAPGTRPAASSTLHGVGNVKAGRCAPSQRKVARNGASRCVKKKHRKHKRAAKHNRRAN